MYIWYIHSRYTFGVSWCTFGLFFIYIWFILCTVGTLRCSVGGENCGVCFSWTNSVTFGVFCRRVFCPSTVHSRPLISANSLSDDFHRASPKTYCLSICHSARPQTKLRVAPRFLMASDSGRKKQTNVQSTRTSVMHLLRRVWFIIDLGAAQNLCCWLSNTVQGHFDRRRGGRAFLIWALPGPLRTQTQTQTLD